MAKGNHRETVYGVTYRQTGGLEFTHGENNASKTNARRASIDDGR